MNAAPLALPASSVPGSSVIAAGRRAKAPATPDPIVDAHSARRAPRGAEAARGYVPDPLPVTVVLADPGTAASMAVHVVAPALDGLYAPKASRWWFLRREDRWHIHLDGADRTRAGQVLDELVRSGILRRWEHDGSCSPHDQLLLELHRADSEGVVGYLRERRPVLAERHVAGILAGVMCRATGLGDLEAADVLDLLACRGAALDESSQLRACGLADFLGLLLHTPADEVLGPDAYAVRWVTELTELTVAAARLGPARPTSSRSARRDRLYDLLGQAMTAQWNRLGLSAADQAVLAVATRDALRIKGQR